MSMLANETPAVLGTLDALRESVDELAHFLRRRVVSRGGTVDSVDSNAARSVGLLPPNKYRHLAIIYNDSTAVLYLALGPNATLTNWSVKLNPDDYYETPAGYTGP